VLLIGTATRIAPWALERLKVNGKLRGVLQLVEASQVGPRVAVAMTTRNAALTIRYSLESLLAQRGVRLSVVIVDSYSNDGTVEVAREVLEHSGIEHRVMRRRCNIPEGRNLSLREALNYDPDYILFLDADVVLRYNNLVQLASAISRGRLVTLISYRRLFLNRERFENFLREIAAESKARSIGTGDLMFSKIKWGGLGATLIPRGLAEKLEFDPDLSFAEDRQLGLIAWTERYPVIRISERRDSPAYDVNLDEPESNIYMRMPLREYLRGLSKKIFIYEVWHNFEGNLPRTLKKFLASKQFKSYAFHALYDLIAATLLAYTAFAALNPQPATYPVLAAWVAGVPLLWARRGKHRMMPLAGSLKNFAKFNIFSISALALFIYT
jgi:glycosyltransferase involved in cell wall biosynthesis